MNVTNHPQEILKVHAGKDHLPGHELDQLSAWLRNLRIDNVDIRALAIVRRGEGYELHLSEFVLNDRGAKQLDLALGEPVTRPRVIQLGTVPTWPTVHPRPKPPGP